MNQRNISIMNEPVAMGRRRALQSLGALAVSSIGAAGLVSAQTRTWPTRPVKYMCPFAAGGATDILSRLYCERMSAVMGVDSSAKLSQCSR